MTPHARPTRYVASLVIAASLLAADQPVGSHLLFDFERGAEGWRTNVYGSGKMAVEAAPQAKVGAGAIVVRFDKLRGGNVISPAIPLGEPWRQRRYDRVRFWAKAGQPDTTAKLVFVTNEKTHPTYSLSFPMLTTEWRQHTYPLARAWNRGKRKLDASRLVRMYVTGGGTMDFALDHIELLEAGRRVYLTADQHAFVSPTSTAPRLDGRLDDAAWKQATRLTNFVDYRTGKPVSDQTEAWVTYDADALYVAARLHCRDTGKLKATETARDAAVWQDDCFELFVDPGQTHTQCYQFVTNSIGSQMDMALPGGEEGRGLAWNGSWTVKTAVEAKAWTVEMRIPFSDLGGSPKPGDAWGFNVCREAPPTGQYSYWANTGGKFTRVRRLGDLVFAPKLDNTVAVADVRLEETALGSYVLRASTKSTKRVAAAYEVWAQSPEDERTVSRGQVEIAAGHGKLSLPAQFDAKQEGEAKVWFTLKDAAADAVLGYGGYNFKVAFPSEADLSKLVLVPSPKEIRLGDGAFTFTKDTIIRIGDGLRDGFIASVIQREIAAYYGVSTAARRHGPQPRTNVVLLGRIDTNSDLKRALLSRKLQGRFYSLKPEGYMLVVEPKRILVAGKDDRGTYYAARTLLQLVANATDEGHEPRAQACTIVDWPDMPFRGYMIFTSGWPQDPLDPDMLKELIYKQIAGHKYNAIVWQMKAGYRYSRWPRLANRCALDRDTVREVAQFARDHFIEIIPNTNIMGHAEWIALKYKQLAEDGDHHQICTRHPMTYPLLFDVLEEMLDVFDQPKRLHVGQDEVRWKTFNLPEAKRCPRCKGIPKWKIYADHLTKLHDFLKSKGVEMWMWGDMLLKRHNGGPPFNCYKALDLIPKDIVICNWSAEYAKGSCEMLAKKGFRVVKANSRQVPPEDAPYVFGNLASFWYRHPWCPMSQVGERGLMMENAYAADFSWNINRESVSLQEWKRERDLNVLQLVARPAAPRAAAKYDPLKLDKIANRAVVDEAAGDGRGWADLGPELDLRSLPGGTVRVGNAEFEILQGEADAPRAVYLTAEASESAALAPRRKVETIAFLHTGVFPEDSAVRKKYLHRFLAPVNGVVIATVRVTYANGDTLDIPLRVGMEVGSWLPQRDGEYLYRCPYILRLATEQCRKKTPDATDAVLYVYEWVNPHPGWRIDRLEIIHTGVEADYALFAIATRARK